jgi:hypothetical protein
MFLGYPRSGHSLLGSLLDAHPDVVIAHEADALRYVQARFTRLQVYSIVLGNSRHYRHRREIIYDYTVPGQWQGRARCLEVIGDKKGGRSTRRLAEAPALLERLRRVVGIRTRFIHVVRNPFDNVATISSRRPCGADLGAATAEYLRLCTTMHELRGRLEPEALLDVRHEDLLESPEETLAICCDFLGVEPEPKYLRDCASILFSAPRRTRLQAQWSPDCCQAISEAIERFDFLGGYSFED